MKKKLILNLFILVIFLMPIFSFAENVKNDLTDLKSVDIVDVTDLNKVTSISKKSDGITIDEFQSMAFTEKYLVLGGKSGGRGAIFFLNKATYSVEHASYYGNYNANGMTYDKYKDKLLVIDSSNKKLLTINPNTFELEKAADLGSASGHAVAYNDNTNKLIIFDSDGKIIDPENFNVLDTFGASIYDSKKDATYFHQIIYYTSQNQSGKRLFEKVPNKHSVVYTFTAKGKFIKAYYLKFKEEKAVASMDVYSGKAYVIFTDGELYTSSALLGNGTQPESAYFHGHRAINVIRNTFANLDYFLYSSIEWIIQGIFDLASLRNNIDIISEVRDKLYVLLGIFMFFKLSGNFINYMLNPDLMNDDKQGTKKLVLRTIEMLVLLLMLPSMFDLLYRVQSVAIPIIPKIFLNQDQETAQKDISKKSEGVAVTILQPYFHPIYADPAREYPSIDGSKEITNLKDFVTHVNDVSPVGVAKDTAGYSYQYRYLLASLVGFISVGLLAGITVSVASRIFKLMVLEMIAPIPIMNNITPNRDVNQNPFNKWLKEVLVTFLDLFIKLAAIYLLIYFAEEIIDNNMFISWETAEGTGITPERLLFLKSFLIVGILFMIYKSPRYINKFFGINEEDGTFVGSVGSAAIGLGHGLLTGLMTGKGVRGSISQGIRAMHNGYHNAAAESLNQAWQDVELETGMNNSKQKRGVEAEFHSNVNEARLKAQSGKLGLLDNIKDAKRHDDLVAKQQAVSIAEERYRTIVEEGQAAGESAESYSSRRSDAYNDWQNKIKILNQAEKSYKSSKETYDRSNSSSYLQETQLPTTEDGQVIMVTQSETTTIGERRDSNNSNANNQDISVETAVVENQE